MATYVHGSAAREEHINRERTIKVREIKRKVYRSRVISAQEKLLYLFTVALCVLVAGVIIWRYAQIYEMNTKIHSIEVSIQQLQAENENLKQLRSQASDPTTLQIEAESKGYSLVDPNQISHVPNKPTLKETADQKAAFNN